MRPAGALLGAWLLAAASPGQAAPHASPLVSFKRTLCLYTLCFLEPLVPDLRREWGGEGGAGWVLSWPLHPWASPPLDVPGPTLIASPFLEPQLRLGEGAWRLVAGGRLYAFPDGARWGGLLEGAGLLGTDGRGGLAGVGLAYDLIERHRHTQPWTLALVYRRTWAGGAARHDVAFDVTVPLAMFRGSPLEAARAPRDAARQEPPPVQAPLYGRWRTNMMACRPPFVREGPP